MHIGENDKGSFIFYDFKAKFKTKLRNKYGLINVDSTSYEHRYNPSSIPQLTFLVPNFRANLSINFKYQKQAEAATFTNPFKVCHENTCGENVDNYYFEEGKSYEIYVKAQKIIGENKNYYAIAPFTFYPDDYDGIYYDDDLEYSYDEDTSNCSNILLNYLLIYSLFILLFI